MNPNERTSTNPDGVVVDHGLPSKPVVDHEAANLRDNAAGVGGLDSAAFFAASAKDAQAMAAGVGAAAKPCCGFPVGGPCPDCPDAAGVGGTDGR